MQKLHLVGFTTDHEGLILSARRGARSGSYVLKIDGALEEAVDERKARREEEPEAEEAATSSRRSRVESALPVREIQARLRQGRTIAEVARAAGVDADWVERFAPPVLAERAKVIDKVRSVPLRRARLGPSVLPIGEAVRRNLADRGVSQTPDEFASAWTARQVADGRWAVRYAYHYRGHDQTLRFDLDDSTGEVSTADRTSGQLGYVAPRTAPTATSAERARPSKSTDEPRPVAKRAVVSTGYRPDPTTKAVSRSAKERERAAVAMRKAAARRAVEGERAANRKLRERREAAARREREEQAAAARAAREAAAAQRAAEAAARAKKAAAKQAAADRAAAAAKAKEAKPKAAKAKAATTKAATTKTASKVGSKTSKPKGAKKPAAKTVKTATKAKPAPVAKPAKAPVARKAPVPRPASIAPSASRPPAKQPARRATAATVPARRTVPTATAPSVRSVSTISMPRTAEPQSTDGARLTGAAENVYGSESARAMFRRGLVEQASGDVPALPAAVRRPRPAPQPNGMDRPRRTRPLRAT